MRSISAPLETVSAKTGTCSGISGDCSKPDSVAAHVNWVSASIEERVRVVRSARQQMALRTEDFAAAISSDLARTKADTLVTELLPLLDACKFLERNAPRLLAPRRLGHKGRPLWLSGVVAEIHREPLGQVLVIGPSNYPLFLPGVQTIQALVAGNTVTWKPGAGGGAVAKLVADILLHAGLPIGVLTITDESAEAARCALAAVPDKVVFTGSSKSGQSVLADLAHTVTPAILELSGADAIVVTPSANLSQAAKAIAFGLRLNGGAVCMSPRRLFATPSTLAELRPLLDAELSKIPAVRLEGTTAERLRKMLDEAILQGAEIIGVLDPQAQKPLLVDHATAAMSITMSDIFAPVLSMLAVESMLHVPDLYARCPYALTVSIFCSKKDEKKARLLAKMLKAGTVLMNDVIAPTADPRVPFGGRGASGYGVTRGAEGLLEMTAVKTLLVRRSGATRHLNATSEEDTPIFSALIRSIHGKSLAVRWTALWQLVKLARH